MNYENSVKRLQEIVNKLESGDLSLDESIALYKEGSSLSKECIKMLEDARLSVEVIMNEEGDKGGENDYK